MEEARRGVTPLVKRIAEKERMSEEFVRNGIASGRIVVPCNPIHDPEPGAVGEGMSIKVNVNLGTSRDMPDMGPELRKLDVALKYGADAVIVAMMKFCETLLSTVFPPKFLSASSSTKI